VAGYPLNNLAAAIVSRFSIYAQGSGRRCRSSIEVIRSMFSFLESDFFAVETLEAVARGILKERTISNSESR
jgi:hypothetical protein